MDTDALIGQMVMGLHVGPEEHQLLLIGHSEAFILDTDGDCCSESWWADINGVQQLIGEQITKVEEIEMPDFMQRALSADGRSRQGEDRIYCVKLTTTRGAADLVFRNSSNGYYGGDWSLRQAKFEDLLRHEWRPVIKDGAL